MATPAAIRVLGTTELVITFLEFLPTLDLLKAAAVCRKWNDIIFSSKSIVIKQKLFAEPLPEEYCTAKNEAEVSGISPGSTFSNDYITDYPDAVVILNPALPNASFEWAGGVHLFELDTELLFETIGPDNEWGETYVCQPPGQMFIDPDTLPDDAVEQPGYENPGWIDAGMTINTLRDALIELCNDFAGGWTFNDITISLSPPPDH